MEILSPLDGVWVARSVSGWKEKATQLILEKGFLTCGLRLFGGSNDPFIGIA